MSDLRALLHQVVDALVERLDGPRSDGSADEGWYDQDNSPLPRGAHLKAVRRGELDGYRVRGRILVKKADMHRYIERHKVQVVQPLEGELDEAAELRRLRETG